MKHYLFIDDESGEEFLVGAYNIIEGVEIAKDNFGEDVRFICEVSEIEAEMSGLDEY